jgi:hypothetical protein
MRRKSVIAGLAPGRPERRWRLHLCCRKITDSVDVSDRVARNGKTNTN